MADPTQTRYFKLETRDRTFHAQTFYAAWTAASAKAVLFFINDSGKAQVLFVINLAQAGELRRTVQETITDVVEFEELEFRPPFSDVDVSQVVDQSDATTIGTILEV